MPNNGLMALTSVLSAHTSLLSFRPTGTMYAKGSVSSYTLTVHTLPTTHVPDPGHLFLLQVFYIPYCTEIACHLLMYSKRILTVFAYVCVKMIEANVLNLYLLLCKKA